MICDNLKIIEKKIKRAAGRCRRNPDSIRLVAVSKRMTVDAVRKAAGCGQLLFGENYLQEAKEKIAAVGAPVSWHFIGRLQSNKAGQAARLFQMIETVDRLKIAVLLSNHCVNLGKNLDILIQVNVGREQRKSGVAPEDTAALLDKINALPNLTVRGLMTMPPFTQNPEEARPYFSSLRLLADDLTSSGLLGRNGPVELSMGMSRDFETAIEEGATLVRVGTAIFGPRS